METSTIQKYSCYAVLKSGFAGENYLIPHMRLVLALIYKKNYGYIDISKLIADFAQEYNYHIDYFPMQNILSLAVTLNYLKKRRNMQKYSATEKIQEFSSIGSALANSTRQFEDLALEFQAYAMSLSVEYEIDDASKIIASYVQTQKLEHISGHVVCDLKDNRIDHILGRFIYYIRDEKPELFTYLNDMVIGSILADCLTFHNVLSNGRQLPNLTVVLDTSVVFMGLGIDIADRKSYYLELFASLKEKGARLAMFEHSYNEMQRILVGAAEWVNNPAYDAQMASITTEYFQAKSATRDDVMEYSYALRDKIYGLGIEIISAEYKPENYQYNQDQKEIYGMIVEKYAAINPDFNELEKRNTISLDAQSICDTYLLRAGIRPYHMADSKYIFITSNRTIAKIGSDYHNTILKQADTIPPVITDVFLGTYLWLHEPTKIEQMNEQQIVSHAYLAFQASPALIEKISESVKSLKERGDITDEQCYALMGNQLVRERIAKRTLGDPNAFTDSTPLEILREIQAEARKEGIAQEALKHHETIRINEQEKKEIAHQHEIETEEMRRQIDSMRSLAIEGKSRILKELEEKKKQVEKYVCRWKHALRAIFVISVFMVLYGVYKLWEADGGGQTNYLDIIGIAVPLLIWGGGTLCSMVTSKTISPKAFYSFILKNRRISKCKKIGYNEHECTLLQDEIDHLKNGMLMNESNDSDDIVA